MTTRETFRDLARGGLILDGGCGTSFFAMGHGGVPGELLNLTHPDSVATLHREYIAAGADIIITNTFGGNRPKLAENGLDDRFSEIQAAAVSIARREADRAGRRVMVFGDIASTGRLPAPSGDGSFFDCRDAFREQIAELVKNDVDGIIIETMTDIKELRAAMIAAREAAPDLPMIAHMAFDESGATLTGASIEVFAAVALDLGADAVGMNCLTGPEEMVANVRRLARCVPSSVIISAEPNAGHPIFDGKNTVYPTAPEEFAHFGPLLREAGANIIGGCCGTTPEHIRCLAQELSRAPKIAEREDTAPKTRITSRTSYFDVRPDEFCVIGERINPAGRRALRDALRARTWTLAVGEAVAQEREGADLLDVNFGIERFFDAEAISDALISLDRASNLPLSLDIQSIDLMERALCEYPGRPLINSTSCDKASLDKKLPLMKKYGGVMILLAMDGDISPDPEERIAAVKRALDYADEHYGIGPERFLVDPLIMSVGAGGTAETPIAVVRACTEMGVATTMGLSNLSHGMPNRSGINAAFVSRAIEAGLTTAIMDPADQIVMGTVSGAMTLRTGRVESSAEADDGDPLVTALLAGMSRDVESMVDAKLAEGMTPLDISQNFIGGAMDKVGSLYERHEIFLPQLIYAAETAFPIFDKLNAMMAGGETASRGRVMLATVQGDIHDIGKNIVGTVLRAGGFEVIDIGKNVPADEIIAKAREHRPDIVGLSAMMTTTVGRVQEVRAALDRDGIKVALISGGASMTDELAQMFGARYSKDSNGALNLCKEIMG